MNPLVNMYNYLEQKLIVPSCNAPRATHVMSPQLAGMVRRRPLEPCFLNNGATIFQFQQRHSETVNV